MADSPAPVLAIFAMLLGLLRKRGDIEHLDPDHLLDDLEPDDLLERYAAPGTLDYWRSLTDSQLDPLRDVIPALDPASVNVVHVLLLPKAIVPEPPRGQDAVRVDATFSASSLTSYFATVRFFPDLEQWRVERLGDLGPPQPERLN